MKTIEIMTNCLNEKITFNFSIIVLIVNIKLFVLPYIKSWAQGFQLLYYGFKFSNCVSRSYVPQAKCR